MEPGTEKWLRINSIGSIGNQMEVQPGGSTPLWESVGATGQKLQEGKLCSVGEPFKYWRCSFNLKVSCRANNDFKTINTSHFWSKRFESWNLKILFCLVTKDDWLSYLPRAKENCQPSKILSTNKTLLESHMGTIPKAVRATLKRSN